MYSKFIVNNFRTFQDLEVEFSPVSVISGRNNAGKTALLEGVFLNAAGPYAGDAAINILNWARGSGPILLDASQPGTIWNSFYHNYDFGRPLRLSGEFNGEAVEVRISSAGGLTARPGAQSVGGGEQTLSQSVDVYCKRGSDTGQTYKQTVTQQSIGPSVGGPANPQPARINFQLTPAQAQVTPAQAQAFLPVFYLSGRTRASQVELATRYSSLRVSGRGTDFVNAMRDIEPRLKSLEILVTNSQPILHVDIGGPDLLPISLFGEGMLATADFISAIYQTKGGVVLIDELENGIHYSVLEKVWRHIRKASQQAKTQVIATTHSRECLQAAKTAFTKESTDPGLGLIRLWRDHNNPSLVRATQYDTKELEEALDLDLDIR